MATETKDPRAADLGQQFDETFVELPDLPVPVESIADDHLRLNVWGSESLPVYGGSRTRQRPILPRRAGRKEPVYSRVEDRGADQDPVKRDANVLPGELLMADPRSRLDHGTVGIAGALHLSEFARGCWLYNLGLTSGRSG